MKTRSFVLVLALLWIMLRGAFAQDVQKMGSKDAGQVLEKNVTIIILDVRTAEEFKAGHVKGAKNIDINAPDFKEKIEKLDKKASYLVYCRTNHRSSAAVEYMTKQGFTNIYQMMDGFLGWSVNHLPNEKQ